MTHPYRSRITNQALLLLLLFSLSPPLPFSHSPLLPRAHAAVDLDALKQLFQKDPAKAFEKSWKMFQEPRKKGNLEGMMGIVRVVHPAAERCLYWRVLEDMAEAAVPAAQAAAKWESLGELYMAYCADGDPVLNSMAAAAPAHIRRTHFLRLADEAYAKAGKHDTKARFYLDEREKQGSLRKSDAWRTAPEPWTTDYFNAQNPGPQWAARLVAVDRMLWVGRDAEAASLLGQLLRDWLQEQPNDPAERVAHEWALQEAAYRLGFRGSESLIPLFVEAVAKPGTSIGIFDEVAKGCSRLWGGRQDLAYQGMDWVLRQVPWKEHHWLQSYGYFARKLSRFGHQREADRLLETYALALRNAKPADRHGHGALIAGLRSDTPPALRRAMVEVHFSHFLAGRGIPSAEYVREWIYGALFTTAPPDQRRVWFVETGLQLLNLSLSVTPPPTAGYTAAHGVADAAWFLEEGGRKDLAEQARSIAAAMAKGDKQVLFQCALSGAESAARDKRWDDAEQKLEAALAGETPSADVLRATLLLEQAKRGLGKAAEGDACRNRALALVDQVGLPAGERLKYLTDFASQARNLTQKTQLLERAKAAGQVAGLDLMVDKLNQQLAELALGSGNLASAKQALLDRVNQQEAQRDRLAFDPLLRQQWFADNLSSYRKLLSVAAKQDDAMLALGCAERMRSRALSDQMAWRKVDMAVRLPKALQKRFDDLRTQRQQVYALLQQTTGLPTGSDTEDASRGAYIPIRGVYIPIRGPLEGQSQTQTDPAKLKGLLDQLAKEESALESVVRENFPAYRMACQTQIPEANQLVQWARLLKNIAILEYTLCDEGLVVTAIAPGFQPSVKLLPVKKEELQTHLTKFRQLVQERSDKLKPEGQLLHKFLISPAESVLANSKQLLIVAEGALQLIPFAALQGEDGKYLAEKYAIAYSPSLTLAVSTRGDGGTAKPAATTALIVAAPDTGALDEPSTMSPDSDRGVYIPIRGAYMPIRGVYMPIRGENGVSDALTMMAMIPLPGAKAEGEAVAKQLTGSTLLTGKDATKEKFLKAASNCDVLHIATHGYADPDVPEFSGLLFSSTQRREDAKETVEETGFDVLTAQEVFLTPLQAKLVTLSACETGLGKDVEGEGVLGLTRAFLYAGAKEVVCSLWSVSDDSTSKLMQQMYAGMQKGMPVEAAMQAAQLSLLKDPKTSHPFYWAAFVDVKGPR